MLMPLTKRSMSEMDTKALVKTWFHSSKMEIEEFIPKIFLDQVDLAS
jgi:hypothetical protein